MERELLRCIKSSYKIKSKKKEIARKAFDYYKKANGGMTGLWSALYNDKPLGKKIYDAIASHVHGLTQRCGYCQDRIFHNINANVEHILPASVYPHFTFTERNLVRACATCNMLKANYDFYVLPNSHNRRYSELEKLWGCYHPRHHEYNAHVERLVIQTNYLSFRAYVGKTPEGVKICSSLLKKVSEFEVKSNGNPKVAQAALGLNQFILGAGKNSSPKVQKLLKMLVENI